MTLRVVHIHTYKKKKKKVQRADIPTPQSNEKIAEMTQPVLQDHMHERTMEQLAEICVPQINALERRQALMIAQLAELRRPVRVAVDDVPMPQAMD